MQETQPEIEYWDIDKIIPYENNHKVHSDKDEQDMSVSIKSQGLLDPPAIEPDGTIISGHKRFGGVKILGWAKCPVRVWHVSKQEAAAMRLTANKMTGDNYDDNALKLEIESLAELDASLMVGTGMEMDELEGLLGAGDALESLSLALDAVITPDPTIPTSIENRPLEEQPEPPVGKAKKATTFVATVTMKFESETAAHNFAEEIAEKYPETTVRVQ